VRTGLCLVVLTLSGLIFATTSAWAETKSIQGTVTGADGKPLAEATVRANRLDAKAEPALAKTDAHGNYTFKNLPAGAYALTAIVKNVPKSHASVKTRSDGWAKVDFDLRVRANSASIKKHYVWVKGEPGTHIGGRWVLVEEGVPPGVSAVDKVGGQDLRTMQQNQAFQNGPPGSVSGH
jgi:carboxypeptidase family protein